MVGAGTGILRNKARRARRGWGTCSSRRLLCKGAEEDEEEEQRPGHAPSPSKQRPLPLLAAATSRHLRRVPSLNPNPSPSRAALPRDGQLELIKQGPKPTPPTMASIGRPASADPPARRAPAARSIAPRIAAARGERRRREAEARGVARVPQALSPRGPVDPAHQRACVPRGLYVEQPPPHVPAAAHATKSPPLLGLGCADMLLSSSAAAPRFTTPPPLPLSAPRRDPGLLLLRPLPPRRPRFVVTEPAPPVAACGRPAASPVPRGAPDTRRAAMVAGMQ